MELDIILGYRIQIWKLDADRINKKRKRKARCRPIQTGNEQCSDCEGSSCDFKKRTGIEASLTDSEAKGYLLQVLEKIKDKKESSNYWYRKVKSRAAQAIDAFGLRTGQAEFILIVI